MGLDLSITSTGICSTTGDTYKVGGVASDGDRRLVKITHAIVERLGGRGPDLVVIEDLQARTIGNGVLTHLVHGAVRYELCGEGVPYVLVPATTLKLFATGNGHADKADMKMAAYKAAGVEFEKDAGGDQCDAWWLRAAGLDALGYPCFDLPARQRDALHRKVTKARHPRKGLPAIEWPAELKKETS